MRITHPSPRSLVSLPAHHFSTFPFKSSLSLPPPKPLRHLPPLKNRAGRPVVLTSRSMAEAEGFSTISAPFTEGELEKYGFKRAEMYKESLTGTMGGPYDRHVFICFQNPGAWLPRVEATDVPLLKGLAFAFKTRQKEFAVKTRITIIEAREGTEFEEGDVLIFPQMIKYKGLNDSNIESFVEDVLVNGKPWSSGLEGGLTGSYIFVCAHGSRDKRCGVCGPILIEKLNEGIESRGLTNQIFVSACSHIGGHKYAGNLIIFNPDAEGKMIGHWYGYVTPEDVPEILDQHIGQGVVLDRLLRGQMGVYPEGGEKVPEKLIPNGTDAKKSQNHNESKIEVSKDKVVGCCQGANGISCCQDASSEISQEKKVKENIEAQGKKGPGKASSWFGSLEQSDVLAAIAVFGAVAAVAVAFSLYRRPG